MGESKTIEVDDRVFNEKLKALAFKLGRNEKEFIREQTALLAREVSRFTPPYASFPTISNKQGVGNAADITAGKDAMMKDMLNIVSTRKSPTINWAKKVFGSGPVIFEQQAAAGVITDLSELGQWHRQNTRPNKRTKNLANTQKKWVTTILLNKYLKSLHPSIGEAKATFYKASLQLGGKVTAVAAVKKNVAAARGSGTVLKNKGKTVGTIKGNAGGLFHTLKHLPRLRQDRLIKALKRGEILAKAAIKKAKFKTR